MINDQIIVKILLAERTIEKMRSRDKTSHSRMNLQYITIEKNRTNNQTSQHLRKYNSFNFSTRSRSNKKQSSFVYLNFYNDETIFFYIVNSLYIDTFNINENNYKFL